ncbi:DUF4956 domain-containing protein [Saccharicrinis aurantiacus]|uniref:DUF4956 domain-containing protein n=1 Tax=Saccharicrinis aurantiacus TaxID=1849719 RepID=UPI0009502CCD|nr:DUF4956 domain-containing protein [Saccharicrinis aurantiacus]
MEIFNMELIDVEDFLKLVTRFALNAFVLIILVRVLYYSGSKRKDYLFTYILIGFIVFLMCFLLENVKLELGFALGLFAIFGIIRYRTRQIEIKEMTYLFLVIGVSVINALANKKISYAELLFTNASLIFVTYLLEKVFLLKHESRKIIEYDKIDLIKPENYPLLLSDVEARTGLKVNRIDIGKIDFLRDSAKLHIHYFETHNEVNFADEYNTDE